MEGVDARKQSLNMARGFERSRLEDELMTAAYEWAAPLPRRRCSPREPGERTARMRAGVGPQSEGYRYENQG